MPVRNTIRFDVSNSYYHVYNRGVNKQLIYRDNADKLYFLSLFERYLSAPSATNNTGVYSSFLGILDILCYCLMDNHFHILVYQIEEGALKKLMQAVSNSYIRYFNHKYQRRGPLFESRYKAVRIDTQPYLEHISRYIHLNPDDWQTYKFSSIHTYLSGQAETWLNPQKILQLFEDTSYLEFMQDYEGHKQMLDSIKYELADR